MHTNAYICTCNYNHANTNAHCDTISNAWAYYYCALDPSSTNIKVTS